MKRTIRCLAVAASVLAVRSARADVTSWFSAGGGYGVEHNDVTGSDAGATVLSVLMGVGTPPHAPVVIGGVVRSVTHFTLGTDLSFAARMTTRGFSQGNWGLALDAGPVARWWRGGEYGRYAVQTVLTAGAPWGLQVAFGAEFARLAGDHAARGFLAVIELDLLRLTLMRQGTGSTLWTNPSPAGGRPDGQN